MSCGCKGSADAELDLDDGSGDAFSDLDDDGMAEAMAALEGNDAQDDESAWDDDAALAEADDEFSAQDLDDEAIEMSDADDSDDELDDELADLEALDDEAMDAGRSRRRRTGVRMFQLIRKQGFDFTFLAPSAPAEVVLQRALRVPPGYYFWLGLRIHNRTIGTGDFLVTVRQTLPSGQDPAEFTSTSTSMVISVDAGDTPPALKIATATGLGPRLKVTLTAKQGSGAPFQLYAEISAVLLARPA